MEKKIKRCSDCHRTEAPDAKGRWQPIQLDKNGICRACRDADAEARAEAKKEAK